MATAVLQAASASSKRPMFDNAAPRLRTTAASLGFSAAARWSAVAASDQRPSFAAASAMSHQARQSDPRGEAVITRDYPIPRSEQANAPRRARALDRTLG